MTKKPSVFFKFLVLVSIIFLVLSAILILVSDTIVRNSFIDRSKSRVGNNIQYEAKDLAPQDFSLKDPKHAQSVFNSLYQRIKTDEIIRIKVWDYSGRVIFSDDKSLVGQRFADNEIFKKALLKGQVVTEISQSAEPENVSELGYKQLLEIYVPITFKGESVPSGVIEAYFKLDDVNNHVRETQLILFVFIFIFTLASFSVLVVVFKKIIYKQINQIHLQAAALEAVASGVIITNTKGTIQWVNTAFSKLTGYSPEEAIGQSTRILNSGKQDKAFYENLWNTIISGKEWHGEVIDKRKDGSLYTEEQTITPVKDQSGKIVSFVTIKQDVTARNEAENALRASELRYRSLFESMEEGFAGCEMIYDDAGQPANFRFLNVNPAFAKLTGLPVENVIGRTVKEVVPGIEHIWIEKYGQVVQTGKSDHFENIVASLGRYYEVKVWPTGANRFSVLFDDITHRKKTEEALLLKTTALEQKSKVQEQSKQAMLNVLEDLEAAHAQVELEKARDEAMFTSVGEGLVAVDTNRKIIIINKVLTDMLGWEMKNLIGKVITELPLEDEAGNPIPLEKRPTTIALTTGKITKVTYYFVRKDKTRFPIAITATPIKLGGKTVGLIEIVRDVTQEKAIDKAKTEFVSLASHQLRTPLSTVKWYSEMLLGGDVGELNEEQKKYLNEVNKGNQRMVDLVNALLDVSRIEVGTFLVSPEPTDVVRLARSVVEEQKPLIDAKQIEYSSSLQENIPLLQVDPALLRMILQNLLSNAAKYTPDKGKINFEMSVIKSGEIVGKREVKTDSLAVVVSDTGYGIPSNQQDKIFTKLFRADNVRQNNTEGTGLGLYMIKSIVEHSGGEIWFESQENKGTTFYVTLPLTGMKKKEGTKALE